jgi:hypothetical protein
MTHNHRTFVVVFLILIGAHLVLIGAMDIYPFADLPFHLAAATIYRYYGDDANQFDEYYTVDLSLQPNVFHFLFCSLDLLPSVEAANRVFYMLYVVLLPLAVLLVIKELGGDVWFSLLAFPLLYNYSVSRGFTGYTIAIPVFVLLFYLLLRALRKPGVWYGVGLAALLVGLFFMHAMAALFAILVLVVGVLVHCGRRRRHGLWLMASIAPVLSLLVVWLAGGFQTGRGLLPSLARYYTRRYLQTLVTRIDILYVDNYHLYGGPAGKLIALGFSIFIILWLILRWVRGRPERNQSHAESRVRLVSVLLVITLVCCLLVPENVGGKSVWALYKRLAVLLMISIIVLGSTLRKAGRSRVRPVLFTAVALVHLTLWSSYFFDFHRENHPCTGAAFPEDASDKTMGALVYDSEFRGEIMYLSFADYHIVWNRGIAVTPLVDFDFGPIRENPEGPSLPSTIGRKQRRMRLGRFKQLDYLLVRGEPPEEVMSEFAGFELSKREGPWLLYERKTRP